MKVCPVCNQGSLRSSRAASFFEKRILRKLYIHPFRCKSCGSRFYRFSLKPHRVRRRTTDEHAPPAFPLSAADSFEEVVEEIRRAEKALAVGDGPRPVPGKKARTYTQTG